MVVVVVLASNQLEIPFYNLLLEGVLGHHAQHRIQNDALRVPLSDLLICEGLQSTRVPSVMPVQLLLHLSSGHKWIIHVDDDAEICRVRCVSRCPSGILFVVWSMLSSDIL